MDSTAVASPSSQEGPVQPRRRKAARGERSCDTCRKRKLKCVRELEQERCVLCTFHQRECTYLDEPQRKGKKRAEGGEDKIELGSDIAPAEESPGRKRMKAASVRPESATTHETSSSTTRSLLSRTLGLHPTMHFKYIGPGSLHEDMLLDFINHSFEYYNRTEVAKFCRVAEGTTFISRPDNTTLFSSDDDDDIEAVERLVRPHGPGLVDLYFRIVHPSYPILHKGVFLEKYARSYREFLPPLLAAVYLLAMDWWEYDQDLSSEMKPDADALVKVATRSLTVAVHRPKLSAVQACLLLLQRSGGDSWALTSQLVAVAEELGLHTDCASWNIPTWEKGLRRRLSWATIMQDKWSSFIYGRPSHVQSSHWQIPPLSLDDFSESAADQDEKEGSTEIEKGRLLFIHLARLTEVMAEALEVFYSHNPVTYAEFSSLDVMQTIELVKTVAVKLKEWATNLPPCLRMEDVQTRKLCSNGYLHLSYFVTEIMIYRCIVRSLSRQDVQPQLFDLCREAAKARLLHVMQFVEDLRPEHLQSFWWFASAKSLAYIRTYASILWATSKGEEEAEFYRQKLEDFRWSLKVRAKGVAFVTGALREMGETLEDIDMSRPPFERHEQQHREVRIYPDTGSSTSLQMTIAVSGSGTTDLVDDGDAEAQEAILQTTPEFLSDLGISSTEAFFADINSLNLFQLDTPR